MSEKNVGKIIDTSAEPNWKKIHRFLLACERAHDPKGFAAAILENAVEICSFDRAIVFFLDGNGKVEDQHLINMDSEILQTYVETFAFRGNEPFSISQEHRERPNEIDLNLIDWRDEEETKFIKEYIRTQHLTYSLAMVFFDQYGNFRTCLALDRFTSLPFSENELTDLYWTMPHLNNLHKNFYYTGDTDDAHLKQFTPENSNLTKRESEIANLLCQGISPANISKSLYISPATTYKHISNIYEKLGISSQRELLALMLNR